MYLTVCNDIVRAISPSALLALEYASWHCLAGFKLWVMNKPRSFSSYTASSIWWFIKYLKPLLFCPNCITMHLEELKGICHLSDHSNRRHRSDCKTSLSLSLLTFSNSFVSSANFKIELVRVASEINLLTCGKKSEAGSFIGVTANERAAFAAVSAFSLPLTPVWLGIQHKRILLERRVYSLINF